MAASRHITHAGRDSTPVRPWTIDQTSAARCADRPRGRLERALRGRPSYWLLLVSRLLLGVSIAGFWAMALAVVAQLVPSERLGRAMTIVNPSLARGRVTSTQPGRSVIHSRRRGAAIRTTTGAPVPPLPVAGNPIILVRETAPAR
jgi:hypothetical protein